MNVEQRYDIMIVGAGFVGLTLAIALAQQGFKIALLEAKAINEKKQQQSVDGRAIALSLASQRILSDFNIWPKLTPFAEPIAAVQVSEQGSFGKLRLTAREQQVAALGFVLPAPQLGAQLLEQAQQQENVTWFSPAQVEAVTQTQDAVSVTLTSMQTVLHAKLMIVAEGMHSSLRQQFSFSATERDYQQVAIIANVSLNSGGGIAYQRFSSQGTLALLPLGEQRFTLVLSVASDKQDFLTSLPDPEFLAYVQNILGDRIGTLHALGPRQSYPLKAVFVEHGYDKRLLLMGNAAHTLNPIAAQGFNLTLRDIAELCELLAESKDLTGFNSVQTVLADYQRLRLQDQKNMLRFTDQLVNIFALPLCKTLRSLGLFALDSTPFIKRRLFAHLLGN